MIGQILQTRRLIAFVAVLLTAAGMWSWLDMPRAEYAAMPDRWGMVQLALPGADTLVLEERLVRPAEDALAEVEEIAHIEAVIRQDGALLLVELGSGVPAAQWDEAWDDVEDALARAHVDMPAATFPPRLVHELRRPESVLLAVTPSRADVPFTEVLDGARRLRRKLLGLDGVDKVVLHGDPGDRIAVDLDPARAASLGITPGSIAHQLGTANVIGPRGSVRLGDRRAALDVDTHLGDAMGVASMPIALGSGAVVPLDAVAAVVRETGDPVVEAARWNGSPAVFLGVAPRRDTHVVRLGEAIRGQIEAAGPQLTAVTVDEVVFDPERIEAKISDLGVSLAVGMALVALVLVAFMGLRMGLVVASIVPLVTFASLQIYAAAGGELNQSSIAGLIVALGMLVDNAIVVAERIQRGVDDGEAPAAAAQQAVGELWLPLLTATGTTLAAFLPMVLFDSNAREFVQPLPLVVMLTLAVSYVVAVTVTPNLGAAFLRPRPGAAEATSGPEERIVRIVQQRPRAVMTAAAATLLVAAVLAPRVPQIFFPYTDHGTILAEIELAEGADILATDAVARRVEVVAAEQPGVRSVAAFVGRGAPLFRYNVVRRPSSPHVAQVMIQTDGNATVDRVQPWLQASADAELGDVHVVARKLREGQPFRSSVEIRLMGDDPEALEVAAARVYEAARDVPGGVAMRREGPGGTPLLGFRIDASASRRASLTGVDVDRALLAHTRGLPAGRVWSEGAALPVVVRSLHGHEATLASLDAVGVGPGRLPVAQLADGELSWVPSVVRRRDRQRMELVSGELETWTTFAAASAWLDPVLATVELPAGVRLEHGGEREANELTQTPLFAAMPVGMLLMISILLAEFRSVRRVGVVLATAPLAAVGAVIGLWVTGLEFGFTSILGAMALVGIVVNNAIVLVDVMDRQLHAGSSVGDALADAIRQRARPVVLTTLTTVAGLLPLALGGTRLWPPMAWVMVFGLLVSAGMSLFVVPVLYGVLFSKHAEEAS